MSDDIGNESYVLQVSIIVQSDELKFYYAVHVIVDNNFVMINHALVSTILTE